MPTDDSGYSLPQIYRATPGTVILAEQHNVPLEDLAQAMSQRLTRDGRFGMVGNLDLGSFRVVNMGDGTDPMDAVTVRQAGDVVAASTEDAPVKNTPVDADSLPLSDSENDNTLKKLTWARVKAVLATVLVPQTRTVTGAGLADGGGDLSANRTITVNVATQAEAEAGTVNTKAMTPLRTRQALDDNVYSGTNTNNTDFPIKTTLIANGPTGLARNSRVNVFLASNSVGYVTNASGAGAELEGTWNKLTNVSGAESTILVQRVS